MFTVTTKGNENKFIIYKHFETKIKVTKKEYIEALDIIKKYRSNNTA